MTEFVFRNLSVKITPPQGDEGSCTDESVTLVACTPCTDLCTGTVPICEDGISETLSDLLPCPVCQGPGTSPPFMDLFTNIVLSAGDEVAELAVLKARLQRAMGAVDAAEAKARSADGIDPVAGIDALRSQLLGAVAELDEHRGGRE
jgi:hypothetical protein